MICLYQRLLSNGVMFVIERDRQSVPALQKLSEASQQKLMNVV